MPDLYSKIEEDLRAALKAKQELKLSTLRLLKSDIQYEMTKTGVKSFADDEITAIIKKAVKKRKESQEQFSKAGRMEQAKRESDEIDVLKNYLSAEVSEEDISKAIDETIKEMKPGPGDTGKVMGKVMNRFKGQNIDGSVVKQLVQQKLQN